MAKWTIAQRVDYYAEDIEAETKEEAFAIYLEDQDRYWEGVWSETITKIEDDEEGEEDE